MWQSWEKVFLSRLGMEFLRSTGISIFFPGVVKKWSFRLHEIPFSSFWIGPRSTKWYSLNAFRRWKCKNTGFPAFHLENEEKRCRQLQGGESADSLVVFSLFRCVVVLLLLLLLVFLLCGYVFGLLLSWSLLSLLLLLLLSLWSLLSLLLVVVVIWCWCCCCCCCCHVSLC